MAQTAMMGPPLSPIAKEPRRSSRRPAPTFTTTTTTSPTSNSPDPPGESSSAPRSKATPQRSTSSGSNRSKRAKQEDLDDALDEHPKNGTNGASNGRTKRKGKEKEVDKDKTSMVVEVVINSTKGGTPLEDVSMALPEEEAGITRCICGSTGVGEDDPEQGGEFMVQCETCNVWQHGLCMGYEAETDLDDCYHCEQCRPDLHEALLKRLAKRMRHASNASVHNSISANSNPRSSRSHSPSHLLHKPAKRRNTMNSRDAAYDESLQEVIEQSAAEAAAAEAAVHGSGVQTIDTNGSANGHAEGEDGDGASPDGIRKRKRVEDDALRSVSIKRNRSVSSESDNPISANVARDETPVNGSAGWTNSATVGTGRSNTGRNKRGGRKNTQPIDLVSVEGDEGGPSAAPKRQANGRAKSGHGTMKRAPPSYAPNASGAAPHDHGTRRNHNPSTVNGLVGTHSNMRGQASTSAAASRAYHQSHEYAVSQQPLYTSWHLPDYLAHLEPMLPSKEPIPLKVQSSGMGGLGSFANMSLNGGRDPIPVEGVTIERGVKVKWPAKRMSVGDMNKRVRALVEWVGREQASASERMRRREALEKALKEVQYADGDLPMLLDSGQFPLPQEQTQAAAQADNSESQLSTQYTMKMMEELMEELINFQERFGPGAKTKERERRAAAAAVS